MKKVLSLLLSIVMFFSSVIGTSLSAKADDIEYTTISTNGSWYNGSITDSNTIDWYKVVVPSDGKITIKVLHYDTLIGYLYNDDFSSCIWDGSYRGGVNSEGLSGGSSESPVTNTIVRVLSKGIYYLSINKHNNPTNYKLSVTFNSYGTTEIEPNDYDTPMILESGKEVIGAFTHQDDLDWYKLYVPQAIEITVKIQHCMDMEWYLYNYDLSNCILDGSRIINGGYNVNGLRGGSENSPETKVFNIKLSKGYYYIKLQKCSVGKYIISWNFNASVSRPNDFRVSARSTTSLKLSWNKVSGASGYQLQRKFSGNYKHITYTSNNYYTVKNLSSATSYAFRVRAYKTINGKRYYSSWRTLTTPTKPSKVSIKTPSTNSKHQIIVKWKALSRGSGYQVQYSRKKNFSSVIATKNVSGKTNTSYTGNNFTKGKTYYVRVRAYKTVNGKKYYGAWSSVKSIKCK